jgi:hypothetical protein
VINEGGENSLQSVRLLKYICNISNILPLLKLPKTQVVSLRLLLGRYLKSNPIRAILFSSVQRLLNGRKLKLKRKK